VELATIENKWLKRKKKKEGNLRQGGKGSGSLRPEERYFLGRGRGIKKRSELGEKRGAAGGSETDAS